MHKLSKIGCWSRSLTSRLASQLISGFYEQGGTHGPLLQQPPRSKRNTRALDRLFYKTSVRQTNYRYSDNMNTHARKVKSKLAQFARVPGTIFLTLDTSGDEAAFIQNSEHVLLTLRHPSHLPGESGFNCRTDAEYNSSVGFTSSWRIA